MKILGFLDRERTIGRAGFNRWLIPPAALGVHLCIGEVYGFSVFNGPLTRVIGIDRSIDGKDWTLPEVGWIYSIALIMLGLSAALFGRWAERVGPRKTIFCSACCFCGGLMVASLGVSLHDIRVVYLGYGFLGGIGLGLGYISPVSTLVKWFPDRPGMATGMAIMGFGGGALIGAPLGVELMGRFQSSTSVGVKEAFLVMACAYFLYMMFGAFLVRVPEPGWLPEGYTPPSRRRSSSPMPMSSWTSPGRRRSSGCSGRPLPECHGGDRHPRPGVADVPGHVRDHGRRRRRIRRTAQPIQHGRALLLVVAIRPDRPESHLLGLFPARLGTLSPRPVHPEVAECPAVRPGHGGHHLDVWRGIRHDPRLSAGPVRQHAPGRIHGRLITAWSMAAVLGPQSVNYISDYRIKHGVPRSEAYNSTMYLMAGLLLLGLICNLLVRPVHERHHHSF